MQAWSICILCHLYLYIYIYIYYQCFKPLQCVMQAWSICILCHLYLYIYIYILPVFQAFTVCYASPEHMYSLSPVFIYPEHMLFFITCIYISGAYVILFENIIMPGVCACVNACINQVGCIVLGNAHLLKQVDNTL